MQHEIKEPTHIFDDKGNLKEAGYSTKTMFLLNKDKMKSSKLKFKSWDYYLVGNKDYAISLTLAHNGYMAVCGIQVFDFIASKKYDYSKFIFKHKRKIIMPVKSLLGHISYRDQHIDLAFDYSHNEIHIKGSTNGFNKQDDLFIDIHLSHQNKDFMSILLPFYKKKKCFYFNEKFNHLKATGYFTKKDKKYSLDDQYAVLDWGRGVWPYDNTWYWSSASGKTKDHHLVGFNFGYGFGDTSKATENMIYYQGVGYKIDDIKFDIPEDFISPWKIYNQNQTVHLIFEPIYDNQTKINYIILGQNAHQVFGLFKGEIMINNEKIVVSELFGFAEKVRNRW